MSTNINSSEYAMNTNLLKSVRVKNGKTQTDMASLIEKSIDTYAKKERGEVYFTPAEMVRVSRTLNLTFSEFNDIFFNSELQFCNF